MSFFSANAQRNSYSNLSSFKIERTSFETSKVQDSTYRFCEQCKCSESYPFFTTRPIDWKIVSKTNEIEDTDKPLVFSPQNLKRLKVEFIESVFESEKMNLYFRGQIYSENLDTIEGFKVFVGVRVDTICSLDITCHHCEKNKFKTVDFPSFYLKESTELDINLTKKENYLFDFTIKITPNSFLIFQMEGFYTEIYRVDKILKGK